MLNIGVPKVLKCVFFTTYLSTFKSYSFLSQVAKSTFHSLNKMSMTNKNEVGDQLEEPQEMTCHTASLPTASGTTMMSDGDA